MPFAMVSPRANGQIPADARLLEVRLEFHVPGSLETWKRFVADVGLEPSTFSQGSQRWHTAAGVVLPDQEARHMLSIDLMWAENAISSSLWLREAPSGDPPEQLREESARLGGYPGFLQRMADTWPGPRSLSLVEAAAQFSVQAERWRLLPNVRPRTFHGLRVFPEVVVWRVADAHRLRTVFQHQHPPDSFEIGGQAELTLPFSANMFDDAAREIWTLITI